MSMSRSQVTLVFLNLMIAHDELSFFEFRNLFFSFYDSIFQYYYIFAFFQRVFKYILLSTSSYSIVELCLQLQLCDRRSCYIKIINSHMTNAKIQVK